MKDAGTSNVRHVSRKLLQCIVATTPVISHVVEVTFWNHCNAHDLLSDRKRLLSDFSMVGKCYILNTFIFRQP